MTASTSPTTSATVCVSTPTSFDVPSCFGGVFNGKQTILSPADSTSDNCWAKQSSDFNNRQVTPPQRQTNYGVSDPRGDSLTILKNVYCGLSLLLNGAGNTTDYVGLFNETLLASLLRQSAAGLSFYGGCVYPSLFNQLAAETLVKKYLSAAITSVAPSQQSSMHQAQQMLNSANMNGYVMKETLPSLPVIASTYIGDISTSNYVSF